MILMLILLARSLGQKFAFVTSERTPESLSLAIANSLTDASKPYQISLLHLTSKTEDSSLTSYSLLADLTYSSILSTRLRRLSSDYKFPTICWINCPITPQNYVSSVYPPCSDIHQMMNNTLNNLGWSDYALFYDDSHCSQEMSVLFSAKAQYFIPLNMPQLAKILITKFLKTSSVKQWVIITNYLNSKLIESTLKESNMMKPGVGVLAGPYSYFGLSEQGNLQVSMLGYENSTTLETFLVDYFLRVFEDYSGNFKYSQDHAGKNSLGNMEGFSLFNHKGQEKVEIYSATCQASCDNSNIEYISGSTDPPLNARTIIRMSLTGGITDPANTEQVSNQLSMNGGLIAVDYYNNYKETLKNFEFQNTNVPCYTSQLVFNKTCYDEYSSKFGLFHLTPHSEVYSIALYNYTKDFDLNIYGTSDGDTLSQKNLYPLFLSIGVPYKYRVNAFLQVLKFMGYEKFAVLCENTTHAVRWLSNAINDAPKLKMTILNSLTKYVFKVGTSGSIVESDDVFQEIVDCKARIVMISSSALSLNKALKKFYEIGLEKGDIFIASSSINLNSLVNYTDPDFKKREPFIGGMMSISTSRFVGEVGSFVNNELVSKYGGSSSGACNYFDCFSLGYYGIQSLILQGKDYESGFSIMSEARKARFPGCNGSIKVVDYTNLRESETYNVSQIQYDGKNYSLNEISRYYPFGSTIYQIVKEPYWSGLETPSELRVTSWSCPFRPSHLKTFTKGKIVVGVICGIIGLFTIISTLIIWKYFWNKDIEELTEKKEMSFQDSVTMATILLEFVQTAGMGPDIGKLASGFKSIASAVTYSIDDFITFSNGVFWYVLLSIILCVAYWIILCIVWLFQLHERFYGFWLFRFFGWSIYNIMPILGNMMFIPIISTLLNVFVCDQSLDGTFSQSILAKDCYQTCWESEHMAYAVISGIFILCYQPLAVYFRPLWQELVPLLHIKALPKYLMMKSVFQVTLIILNKTLKRFNAEEHAVVFILLVTCYFAAICWKDSYNYTRVRLWHRLGTVGLIWFLIICTVNEFGYTNQVLWVCLMVAGWIVIAVVGVLIQRKKYPSLLYRQAPKDIEKIFRWMFNLERSDSVFKSKIYMENNNDGASNDRMIISSK